MSRLFIVLAILAVGGYLLNKLRPWQTEPRDDADAGGREFDEAVERAVLALAAESGGRLTVADVAMHTKLNVDDARAMLESFHMKDVAYPDATGEGYVAYTFPSLAGKKPEAP